MPGQLEPLLDWLGVGAVVTGTDDDIERSGAVAAGRGGPRARARRARREPDARVRAERVRSSPPPDRLTAPARLPQVRRYDIAAARASCGVEPRERRGVLVDGSAEGVAGLAAFGALARGAPLAYAGDLERRRAAARGRAGAARSWSPTRTGAGSCRRRGRARPGAGRSRRTRPIPVDAPRLEPFGDAGRATRRPSRSSTARRVAAVAVRARLPAVPRAPAVRGVRRRPGRRGGRPTASCAAPNRWVEVALRRAARRAVHRGAAAAAGRAPTVTEVEVAGRRFPLEPGWNRLELGLRGVDRLRVRITGRDLPDGRRGGPGRARRGARPRAARARAAAGRRARSSGRCAGSTCATRRSPTSSRARRATGPFRRQPVSDPRCGARSRDEHSVEPALIREAGDAERDIEREIAPPQARAYDVDAWVSVAAGRARPGARPARGHPRAGARSSRRAASRAGRASAPRARSTATRRPRGSAAPIARARAWIEWRTPRARDVVAAARASRRAGARCRRACACVADGGGAAAARSGRTARSQLPRPVPRATFRLEVLGRAASEAGRDRRDPAAAASRAPDPAGRARSAGAAAT